MEYESFDVSVFDRNVRNHEKGCFLILKIARAVCEESPGILILVAGDGNYHATILEAISRKWKIEIWFWNLGMTNFKDIKNLITLLKTA